MRSVRALHLVPAPALLLAVQLGAAVLIAVFPQAATASQEPTAPAAKFKLGKRFLHGEGVPQDNAEAVKWIRKAAEQGQAMAQNFLGLFYRSWPGVPQDYVQAVQWHLKAA